MESPNRPLDPSQRHQRLANFLLAVVLRLEGVRRPPSTLTATCPPDDTEQQDRPTQQEPWSPDISPVNSNSTVSPACTSSMTSDKVSFNASLKSQSSNDSASYHCQSEATDTSLTPKTEPSTPQRPVITDEKTPSVARRDSESSHPGKVGSCPCTIFYTPEANLNPRMFLKTAGGKFTGKCGASPANEYYSTPNPTFPKQNSHEIATGKDADGNLGDWKHMKDDFISEASNLYRDAVWMTNSARLVEGVVYHSVAQVVVEDVLKNVRQKMNEGKFDESLSTVNYHNEALKQQKQQVKFKVPVQRNSRQREFSAPRQCTPFRPAPPAPQKISDPIPRIPPYDDSDDLEENYEEFMDAHNQLKFTTSSSELGRSNTENAQALKRHSSYTRMHQESPPIPFRLRATNPVCNRLLRKMVEKHFSGENTAEKKEKDNIDESISETGDAKSEGSLEVESKKTTGKKFLSTTTQTEEIIEKIDKSDALIQTQLPKIEVKEKDKRSVEREIQTDDLSDKDIYDSEDRRICKRHHRQSLTPPAGDGREKKIESAVDLKKVSTCAKDIMMGSGDYYREQAKTIVTTVIYRAVSRLYVEGLLKDISEKLANDSSTIFESAIFDRNTPNVPDSAKESLNIVSRTSSSSEDDLFQWTSSGFERAAASLIKCTPQSEFIWTPYRGDISDSGPNRASGVIYHPQLDSRQTTKVSKDEKTTHEDQDVYLSAQSSITSDDDEFEDACSQNSDAPQLQNEEKDAVQTREVVVIDDSTLKTEAEDLTDFIIHSSLAKIDIEHAQYNREDRDVDWRDVIVVSETSSATQHDHTYIKPDIGGTRDSATTIETALESLGESGFSEAEMSMSDLMFNEDDDIEAIKAIVDPFMRRAVDVIVDGVKEDWSEFLEIGKTKHKDAESASKDHLSESENGDSAAGKTEGKDAESATEDDLSESESGDSAASSYHSTSDLTDVTLMLSEAEQNTPSSASVHIPQIVDADENASKKHSIKKVEPERSDDSLPLNSYKKEPATDVKSLIAQFQDVDDASETSSIQEKPPSDKNDPAIHDQGQRDTMSGSNATCDQQQSLNWTRIALQSRSGSATYSGSLSDNSVLGTKTPSISSDITRSSQDSETVKADDKSVVSSSNTVSAPSSPESRSSRTSLKREAETSTESDTMRKRSRPQVKTHVFFWEKLRDRKKVKKTQEKPIKPETPTKETIYKFEEIAKRSSSSPMEFPRHKKKPGMRRRISETLHLGTKSKHQTKFWKNKAFFSALEKQPENEYSSSREHIRSKKQSHESDQEEQVGLDDDIHKIYDVTDQSHGSSEIEQVLDSPIQTESVETMTNEREENSEQQFTEHEYQYADDHSETCITDDHKCEEDTEQQFTEHKYQEADDHSETYVTDDQDNPENLKYVDGYESENSRIEALVKPSKSEEEIQAWMEKCKKIKERTALLLKKQEEDEHQFGDGDRPETNTTDATSLTSGPSCVSSHDTGVHIFPFGVPITGDQMEMFNPDQHIAALEQDSDWVASSDDNLSTHIEAVLKESTETLTEIDKIRNEAKTEDSVQDAHKKSSEHTLSAAESFETTTTSYDDVEMSSGQTSTKQGSFNSAMDMEVTHETREPKTQAERLLIAKPLPKTQSLQPQKTQPLLRAKPLQETQPMPQMKPLPKTTVIKKKKKGIKLFKIFKSKKGRKMANKRISTESAGSGETSEGTVHVHSPSELNLGSASWSTHAHLISDKRRDHNGQDVMNEPIKGSDNHTDIEHALNVHSPSELKLESDSWSHVNLPSKQDKVTSQDTAIEAPHMHTPSELHTDSWSHVHLAAEKDRRSYSSTATEAVQVVPPSELNLGTDSWSHVHLPSDRNQEKASSTTTDTIQVYSHSPMNLESDSWSHINLPSDRNKDKSRTTVSDAIHMHSPSELQSASWSHVNLPSDGNRSKSSATASDAIYKHSPSELQSDSWSTNVNTPSDGGNRSDSWEISGITSLKSQPAITPSTSEVSATDTASTVSDEDKSGKRSLRKRLFNFGGLRKSSRSKSSRHPVKTK